MEYENYYGIIYCAINLVNGKKYIGKTTRSLENRRREHLSCKFDTVLSKSIQKHGTNSFLWEIIDYCTDEKELNEKEVEYIKQFSSHVSKNGYNMTWGEDGWDVSFSNVREKIKGENHYLNQMSEEEKDEWMKNNMCGENHSHKKHCDSEEEYERWLDENKRGDNHPTKKYKTEEEFQEWVDKTYRGENHYTKRMTEEKYEEWLKKQKAKTYKHDEETKKKMSKGQLETEKGRKHKCVITCPDGKEYVSQSISRFCNEYNRLYNINPKLKRKVLSKIAKDERSTSERGFWCRFYDKERDFNIPKREI